MAKLYIITGPAGVGKSTVSRLYLKSDLINYYEKFGAKYIEDLSNGEKLYYIEL